MRKFKKFVALGLCLAMVASLGIGANAASNVSYSFYVDSAGNEGYSDPVNKNLPDEYAYVKVSKITFNGTNLSLTNNIRYGTTQVSSSHNMNATGSYQYAYYSGKNITSRSYKIYGKTATSCGYGVILAGTWTP